MKRIHRFLDIVHKHVTKGDWDEVLCICGYNGKGKTHLGFHMLEYWLKLNGETPGPEHVVKHIGMDSTSFAKVLEGVKKFDPVMDDEAGDINSRQAMSKVNKLYMEAYQVIRAENLLTIIILPDYFMLDSYFRKHRVRHLWQVYERGRCQLWSQKRLQRLNDKNSGREFKTYSAEDITINDTYPIYKGLLLDEYKKMKAAKMEGVRKKLFQEVSENQRGHGEASRTDRQTRDKAIKNMLAEGMSNEEIAEALLVKPNTIRLSIQRMRVNDLIRGSNVD